MVHHRCPSSTPARLAVGLGPKKSPYGVFADSPQVWFPRCLRIRRLQDSLVYEAILLQLWATVKSAKTVPGPFCWEIAPKIGPKGVDLGHHLEYNEAC